MRPNHSARQQNNEVAVIAEATKRSQPDRVSALAMTAELNTLLMDQNRQADFIVSAGHSKGSTLLGAYGRRRRRSLSYRRPAEAESQGP
jgi:hypothetical protein